MCCFRKRSAECNLKRLLAVVLGANKCERPPGFGKIAQNGQTEPKQSLGLPEGDVFFSFYIAEYKRATTLGRPYGVGTSCASFRF